MTKSEASRRLSSFGERRNTGSQLLMFPSLLGYMNLHNSSIFQFLFLSLDVTIVYHHSFSLPFPIQSYLIREGVWEEDPDTDTHIVLFLPLPFFLGMPTHGSTCVYTHTHTHTYTLTYTHTLLSAPPYCPLGRSVNFSPVETRWVSLSNSVVQY